MISVMRGTILSLQRSVKIKIKKNSVLKRFTVITGLICFSVPTCFIVLMYSFIYFLLVWCRTPERSAINGNGGIK